MAQTMNTDHSLPKFVTIEGTPRFSANQLRLLQAVTGQKMEQVMNDPASVMQAFVWFRLREQGFDPSWDEAGDIPAEFQDQTPDPT
jgi:hypothetical protein